MKTPPLPGPAAERRAASHAAARLVQLDPGLYAFSLADTVPRRAAITGLPLPAIHVCTTDASRSIVDIVDDAGRPAAWLGGSRQMLFVKSPMGGAALVTAYLARQAEAAPLQLEIRRLDQAAPIAAGETAAPLVMAFIAAVDAPGSAPPVPLDVVIHVRRRGDVRFGDGAVVGRLGQGFWIEAFTIGAADDAAAGAIEYKGLSASGSETPWLPCGSVCGTTGLGMPLVGFAMRQKAVSGGARFDCEYTGYFQSGTVSGPHRNGAPCRSPRDNDPLEGMTLHVTPRAAPARG